MLRASISLSRKVTRDFNSTSYSVTFDGEIPHAPDDAEAVLEKVSELFHLAEEALAVEIARDQPTPQAARSSEPPTETPKTVNAPKQHHRSAQAPTSSPPAENPGTSSQGTAANPESATLRQRQFLQYLSKRKGLSRDEFQALITEIVGSSKNLDDLTKREAGHMIDRLSRIEVEKIR